MVATITLFDPSKTAARSSSLDKCTMNDQSFAALSGKLENFFQFQIENCDLAPKKLARCNFCEEENLQFFYYLS